MNTLFKLPFFFGKVLFIFIVCLMAAPLLVVLSSWFAPMDEIFIHLSKTDLLNVLVNTLWLLLGVAAGTTFLGVSLAWLTATLEFPGRSLFDWALILPLAIPTYVLAFADIALFDETSPIQNLLRSYVGHPFLPSIRSTGGVILVMTFALYPYVYLLARNAFLSQGARATEVARSLGQRPIGAFFKIALPMARPMIASGLMLVLMETLSDFGAVSIFNYDTFTTTIYKAWFSMFSIDTAAKFSSLLVLLVFLLLLLEQKTRAGRRYLPVEKQPAPVVRVILRSAPRRLAFAYCALTLLFAFIVPVIQLLIGVYAVFAQDFNADYFGFLKSSLLLAGFAALLTTALALMLVYASRSSHRFKTALVKFATLGYALPGAMLAVGGIILATFIHHQLKRTLGVTAGFFIGGSIAAMMLGYLSRFMILAYNPIESAMHRITPHMAEAAQSLGANRLRVLQTIEAPLLKGGLLAGAILVFVDVMKEMPITLMMRPFGWDTLAVRIFQFTSEGEWERAALPALTLVLLGLLPVIVLTRQQGWAKGR